MTILANTRRSPVTTVMVGVFGILAVVTIESACGRSNAVPQAVITSPTSIDNGAILLDPVPEGYVPKIDQDQAVQLAQDVEPSPNGVIESVRLAAVSNPGVGPVDENGKSTGPDIIDKVPAWVVVIDNLCVPYMGPAPPKDGDGCAGTQANVVIDASTGNIIEDYSYQ